MRNPDPHKAPKQKAVTTCLSKRAGDAFVLYSVGPDGIDNDGAEIQTVLTDRETGARRVTDRLSPDSTGDIVAPVL